ncbi:MAG TPA: DoxX family protein [Gammaproteobacteria bacterium]|nr:DoxX family protein [Gammaproteobacteria bacterium]
MGRIIGLYAGLDRVGEYLAPLALRLVMAYEFWESGVMKLGASGAFGPAPDWFAGLDYPFPINILPATLSWIIAMWAELLGAVLLVLGLATRPTALVLIILDVVAWASVHAGNGYNVCDNGWKLPLLFLIMLLPLALRGGGKLSLDHPIGKRLSG